MASGYPHYAAKNFEAAFGVTADQAVAIARDYAALLNFDAPDDFSRMVFAAGRGLHAISTALQARYGLAAKKAGAVSLFFANVATSRTETLRRLKIGITKSVWMASGRPDGHARLDGKKFDTATGLKVDGQLLFPGVALGCHCLSQAVIPGL
jgi:hypothetical protein